jgi:amino acid permease
MEAFSIGIGIYVLSLAGHACLPSIYKEMRHPEEFDHAVNVSFIIMYIIYASIAIAGYIVYGNNVDVLVSVDISRWPGGIISTILTSLIVAGVLCTIAPVISVLSSIPEEMLGWYDEMNAASKQAKLPTSVASTPSTSSIMSKTNITKSRIELKIRLFRLFVLFASSILAYLLRNQLNFLEAITGGFSTMMTSLIIPCIFALTIMKNSISICEKVSCILFAILGVVAGCYLTTNDILGLVGG